MERLEEVTDMFRITRVADKVYANTPAGLDDDEQIGDTSGLVHLTPPKEPSADRIKYPNNGYEEPSSDLFLENIVQLKNYEPIYDYHARMAGNKTALYLPPPVLQPPPHIGLGVYLDGQFYSYHGLSPEQVEIINTLPHHHRAYVVKIANGTFDHADLVKLDDIIHFEEHANGVKRDNNLGAMADIESIIKDFASTSEIWSRCFLNYSSYLICFNGHSSDPKLLPPLMTFHSQIVDLAKTYPWDLVAMLAFYWTGIMTSGVNNN